MLAIPGYQLLEQLPGGAMAQHWRARRTSDDAPVLLKICLPDPALPERLAGFQREYQLLRSLDIAAVPHVYALEISAQHLVMVCADDGAVSPARQANAAPLSLLDFLRLAIGLASALEQLHACGVLHKNLNPDGILYQPESGQATLIDLSLAGTIIPETMPTCPAALLPGALPYLAPEQTGRRAALLDQRGDLYALGVLLYELLAGHLPFAGDDADALIDCHLERMPVPPHERKPGIPPIFSAIILTLMAKDPTDRYQSAADLRADLAECLQQLTSRYYIEPFTLGHRRPPAASAAAPTDPAALVQLRTELATERERRRQAEKSLHTTRDLFQSFIDHAPAAIFVKDIQGRYMLANDRAGSPMNLSGRELVGKRIADILPPPVVAAASQAEQQVIADGRPVESEQEIPFPDSTGTYLITRFPVYDEQGEMYAIGGIASDITRRKQAEEALRLAQFSLDYSADEILWIGADQRILYVNNAACSILGYSREELLQLTIADINPAFPIDNWEAHWNSMKQQSFIQLETHHQRKDGSIFPVEVTSTYLAWNGKEYLCSFIRDITRRKQAEETLRKWADIFHYLKMGVVVSDIGSATLDMMNPAFAGMYGYTVEELTGRPISAIYAAEARTTFEQSLQMVQQQDHVVFEAHHRRKDGSTFPVLVDVTVIRDRPDQAPYRIANVQDLTERKRSQSQLLEQHEALTMLRERERLARELHDNLGQVLGYIKTQAQATRELLARAEISTADSYLNQMISAAQEHQTDIREFILGATLRGNLEQGFFATLHQYLQRFKQLYAINVALEIEPNLSDQVFPPATDVQLMRIVQEALANCRKHARAQEIHIGFAGTPDHVRMVVTDDGCGFDPEHLPVPATDGRHYGLRSMRERAAEIGAHLRIEAQPGAGTRVILQLPRHTPQKRPPDSVRVLLVDDHPLFLQGMQNLLVGRGVTVVGTAADGFAALAQARSLRPDLILMDVEMPNCNGLDATRRIKAELPDTQIVMLTMSEDEAHLFEAIKGGASGYLLKGLDSDQFFLLLTSVMEGEMVISPGLASRVLAEFARDDQLAAPPPPDQPLPASPASLTVATTDDSTLQVTLSDRQLEVLALVARGYTYQEIGDTLHLSKHTVRYHMREIISQLHFRNRAEIIAFAQRKGLA